LAGNAIKKGLGLPPAEEEEKVERDYLEGRHGRSS
jgi:hypothetical protein